MASGVSGWLALVYFPVVVTILLFLVASRWPTAGVLVYAALFGIIPMGSAPEGGFTLEAEISDCSGVSSNWHYFAASTPLLEELFISCVTTDGDFVIKRVDADDFSVTEIPLASGLPTTSSIFAYLQIAVCPTANGLVVGTILPRADLGSTPFYGVVLDASGVAQGTVEASLPGARADRQAFFCRSAETLAQFVYHGAGEAVGETDTHFILVSEEAVVGPVEGVDQVAVRDLTEMRETDLADVMPSQIVDPDTGETIRVVYEGLQPVAEIDLDLDGDGSESEVRYGGIVVPIMFDTMETTDFRNWSDAVTD